MKKNRQLHLWIGLLTSVLILIEAVTGLLMNEPWLMGLNKPSPEQHVEYEQVQTDGFSEGEGVEEERHFNPSEQGNSMLGVVRNLHAGRIGDKNVRFLLDIISLGLIVLTITGITMSIKRLRAQSATNRKKI